jgi:hypothetical protein
MHEQSISSNSPNIDSLSLCLAISLRVIGSAHLELCLSQFEKLLPNITCENFVPIRDQCFWQTMQLENIIHKCNYYLEGSEGVLQWNKVGIVREFIYHP